MPDVEMTDGDAVEQLQDPEDAQSAAGSAVPEVALEAPEADAVEQQTELRDADRATPSTGASWDADEGDLAESSREVGYDEDDYR